MDMDDTKDTPEMMNTEVPTDLIENAVDVSTAQDEGVRKVILREGNGEEKPGTGDEVVVHYTGTLLDGTKFDSSRDRDDKFKFKLGQGQVIKAWDQGVASMKKGELCRLICRSDYAYGESGSPPKIPPKATLIFEVELFDWKGEDLSEDGTGGIIRSMITKSSGYITPNEGAQVQVSVKGTYEDQVFDERDVSFSVGDAGEENLPEGIDVAIRKFKSGEKSLLTLKPEYAFGSEGSKVYNIPGGATVKYEVTLKDMERAKESWELDPEQKLSQSELAKDKGTAFFKAGKYSQAIKKYKIVTKLLDDELDFNDDQKISRKTLALASNLNCALCYLKQSDWAEAKEACNKALEFDSDNEKALFRLGQAYNGLKEWPEAKRYFQAVIKINADNKTAKNQLQVCDNHLKLEKEREKKLYANMFSRGSSSDTPKQKTEMANGDSSEV